MTRPGGVRRLPVLLLVTLAVPALLAVPVISPAAPAPQPVPPSFATVDLSERAAGSVERADAGGFSADAGSAVEPAPRPATRTQVRTKPLDVQPFRLVAVTWAGGSQAATVQAWVRYRSAGSWSPWTEIPAEAEGHGPDAGSAEATNARGGTEPLLVGPSDGVQVRVDSPSGSALPADLRVDMVDPGTSSSDATVGRSSGSAAVAAAVRPEILTRAQWGADETLREQTEPDYGTIIGSFVHHTVNTNSYAPEDVPALMRSIYAYHVQGRGWRDIGYNFVVDRWGRIWEGRYGGTDRPVVGAHTEGYNDQAFAMSGLGDFASAEPPAAMVDSFGRLFAWKLGLTKRDPLGLSPYRRGYLPVVSGHRDTKATECPGARLYARLGQIRNLAAVYQGPPDLADSQAFVRQLYRDFLGRQADPGGLDAWVASIRLLHDREKVAGGLATSTEHLHRRVDDLYRSALGRGADPGGQAGWAAQLGAGMTWPNVAGSIYGSEEAFNRSGRSMPSWLDAVYRAVLGRPVDPAGRDGWIAIAASAGRPAVVTSIARSEEARVGRVDGYYRTYLDRPADGGGLAAYSGSLIGNGDLAVPAGLAGSEEYWWNAQ